MALSGSEDFSLNAREIIKHALRLQGRLPAGQNVDADIMENGRIYLNLMLKSWQKYHVIWLRKTASVTLVAADITAITQASPGVVTTGAAHNISDGDQMYISGISGMTELNGQFVDAASASGSSVTLSGLDTSSYTAYSSGGKIYVCRYNLAENPRRVYSARFRQYSSSAPRDLPMTRLSYDEYQDLPVKQSTGIPTQFYFDPTRTQGHLYIWPVIGSVGSTAETIEFTYQSRFDDIDDLSDDLEVTEEALETVAYNLSERMLTGSGVDGERAGRISQMALNLKEDMIDDSREESVQFEPGYR